MNNKTRRNMRLLMTKNSILMLVMLVVIMLAVFAWFSFSKTVKANDITVKAISSEIDIAHCVKTYDSKDPTKVLTDGPGVFTGTITFDGPFNFTKDCTGDGVDLIVPEFNVTKDPVSVKQWGKDVNVNLNPANAVSDAYAKKYKELHPDEDMPEYQYVELEFYTRSKNKNMYLDESSVVISRTESDGKSLSTTSYTKDNVSVDKKSAYGMANSGSFNVDGLVGAIRVALIGQGCSNVAQEWTQGGVLNSTDATKGNLERQILWVPRPDVYLNVSSGDGLDNWTMDTGVLSTQHEGESYKHTYYKKKTEGTGVEKLTDSEAVVSSGTVTSSTTPSFTYKKLGKDTAISGFSYDTSTSNLVVDRTDTTKKDDYYVTKYTMRVWIEGTDAEARRAMDGAEFSINLQFK